MWQGTALLRISATAALWILLFRLNSWVFVHFHWTPFVIDWIFLPAAVRLLGVMLLGRQGAMGLWVGTLITNGPMFGGNALESIAVATLSATGPLVAVYLTMRWLKVGLNLQGLTTAQLTVFAVVGALCNVIPHNVFFWLVGITSNLFIGLIPMFVGDLLGTVIVLYALRAALLIFERFMRSPTV